MSHEESNFEYLRADVASAFAGLQPTMQRDAAGQGLIGVDEGNRCLRGYVVAERGEFKTGRGEFDDQSLRGIVRLMAAQPDGLPVNYGHHEDVGSADALDAFLGRAKNPRLDGGKARADLYLSPVAFLSPNGGASNGEKVMTRAKSDPRSFGSSLVLTADKTHRLDARGRKQKSADGSDLPPIWKPTMLRSSDLVSCADAVHSGLLGLSDDIFLIRARWENRKRKALSDQPRHESGQFITTSDHAEAATAMAKNEGTAEAHNAARDAHKAAEADHRAKGNTPKAAYHARMAKYHGDMSQMIQDAEPAYGCNGPTLSGRASVEVLRARWANMKRKAAIR